MADNHWEYALRELEDKETGIFGPKSFIGYLQDLGEDPRDYRTAAQISIDTYRDLSRELRQNDTMVFRLGFAPEGPGTAFGLVKVENHLEDFFIQEEELASSNRSHLDFSEDGDDLDLINIPARDMLDAYRLLPNFSESSFVNLALSTGILGRSLNLDGDIIGTAPTTISSSFSFSFRPHSHLSHEFYHDNGQVEVDALIITRRNGKRVMLVIEAKQGRQRALAKHKLMYPFLAVNNLIADDIDQVIPLYMRASTDGQNINYDIYEGTVESPEGELPAIDELIIKENYHYSIQL